MSVPKRYFLLLIFLWTMHCPERALAQVTIASCQAHANTPLFQNSFFVRKRSRGTRLNLLIKLLL